MLRMSESELKNNTIIYTYPCGDVDIICASDMAFKGAGWEEAGAQPPQRAKRAKGKKSEGEDQLRSMRRARAKLRRLALANDFDVFVTLTLDPAKVDRYDGAAVTKLLNRWTDNMVRRHGMRYILVPEQHKDGAWHFHGFIGGIDPTFLDGVGGSGGQTFSRGSVKLTDSGVRWDGRPVYNLPQWSYGYTTAQQLYGTYSAAVGYCCKYIGKQGDQRPLGRWYYSGGALAEPEKTLATLDYRQVLEDYCGQAVELDIPGSKILVVHTKEET